MEKKEGRENPLNKLQFPGKEIGNSAFKQTNVSAESCKGKSRRGSKPSSKDNGSTSYSVIVTFVPITEEEAKIKRAIIESILKKT